MKELYLLFGVMSLVLAAKVAEPPEDATEEEKNSKKKKKRFDRESIID